MIASQEWALVIVDMVLPGKDGVDVGTAVERNTPTWPNRWKSSVAGAAKGTVAAPLPNPLQLGRFSFPHQLESDVGRIAEA